MSQIKRVLSHSFTVCFLFSFILISGQSTGFFYLTLLMLGLTHALMHSILGMAGLILVILSASKKRQSISSTFGLSGAVSMILSLVRFFTQPGGSYNYSTFRQVVPLLILILFSISMLLFILKQFPSIKVKRNNSVSLV